MKQKQQKLADVQSSKCNHMERTKEQLEMKLKSKRKLQKSLPSKIDNSTQKNRDANEKIRQTNIHEHVEHIRHQM